MMKSDRINLDYLKLANGVRLHYCRVRQQHWLLFPEGAIALNTTAVAVLTCCNGDLCFKAIVRTLESQFREVNITQIGDLLQQMMRRGLLIHNARQ